MEDFFNENNFQESETLLFMKAMGDRLLINIEKLEKEDRLLINKEKMETEEAAVKETGER